MMGEEVPSGNLSGSLTWNETNGTARIYVEGELKDTNTNLSVGNSEVDDVLGIMARSGGVDSGVSSDTNLEGIIDEIKIFNYALTEEQVKTEFTGGAVRFGS